MGATLNKLDIFYLQIIGLLHVKELALPHGFNAANRAEVSPRQVPNIDILVWLA